MFHPFAFRRCAVTSEPMRPNNAPHPEDAPIPQREVNSQELMQGNREIVIRHGTEAYRLSVTRSGKLILRK
jgi:hemin uptake protein HemP